MDRRGSPERARAEKVAQSRCGECLFELVSQGRVSRVGRSKRVSRRQGGLGLSSVPWCIALVSTM